MIPKHRFWSSDHHFFHENIIGFCGRPFADVDEMNSELIRRHNSVVGPDDVTIFLGDFAFKHPSNLMGILEQMNGEKYLLSGNHDRIFSGMGWKERAKIWKYFADAFDMIISFGEPVTTYFKDGDWSQKATVCHFPFEVGRHDSRFSEFHPEDDGGWILHGHTHSPDKVRGRQIHVGVDAWDYYPVSDAQIIAIMRAEEAGDE